MTETKPAHQRSQRKVLTVAIAACLMLAPTLVGCSVNPIESVIEGATGGNVDVGGTSIPDDFPSGVPLIGGEVVNAIAVGTAPEKIWTVTMKVADASALETIKTDLEAAGFASEISDAAVGNITGGMYTGESHSVLVVVAEDKDAGWLVTYTVAPAAR